MTKLKRGIHDTTGGCRQRRKEKEIIWRAQRKEVVDSKYSNE